MAQGKTSKGIKGIPDKKRQAKQAGISEKLIRLIEIYTLIAQKHYPTVKGLKERFMVTERTVYRYLGMINLIDPIEIDKDRGGYVFKNGDRIKKPLLSDDELTVLLAAGEAVSHLGGTLKENFRHLLERITTPGRHRKAERPPIIVKVPNAIENEKINKATETILAAIHARHCLDVLYKAKGSKEATHRRVEPYGLVFYDGVWILAGYCQLRCEIRSFALDRIMDIAESPIRYILPRQFDLEEYFSRSWGFIDDKEVDVSLVFSKAISDYILRKEQWHTSEKRTILPDGAVELTFTVAGTDEIKKWIYSWLPHVEIRSPGWFREQVQDELTVSAKKHE